MFERSPKPLGIHILNASRPPSPNQRISNALRDFAMLLCGIIIAVVLAAFFFGGAAVIIGHPGSF